MNFKSYKLNIKAIIIALYLSVVWISYIYVEVTCDKLPILLLVIFIFIGSYLASDFILNKLDKCSLPVSKDLSRKQKSVIFLSGAIITFLLMLIWYIAYYPGAFGRDQFVQYEQALSGEYNDWHPVWHTLVFFTFPLKLTGSVSSIILFQVIYYSLIMGYLTLALCKLGGLRCAIISCLYIWLNPYISCLIIFPMKDVASALGGLLCLIISIQFILNSERIVLWKIIIFGILWASSTIFRHNAILYTLPLLVALFFNLEKKTWFKLLLCSFIMFFLIKIPIYNLLDVSKPGSRVLETMGLPLTVIANVAKDTPERMDEELSDFVYSMASQEQWNADYVLGDFNSIKWSGIDTSIVEEKGYLGMLRLMIKCFRLSPTASFRALFALTDIVYGFETGLEGNVNAYISEDSAGRIQWMSESYNYKCRSIVEAYSKFVNGSIFKYFRTYGVALLAILICLLSNLKFSSWESWKKIFLIIPVYVYNFGTMLLLTGPDSRFFLITFLAAPLLIVYSFKTKDLVG